MNGGWGIGSAGARWGCSASSATARPTNRAWADPFEVAGTGVADAINGIGQVVHKNNPVDQPNHHWGDGLEKDALSVRQLPDAGERGGDQRDLRLRRLQPPGRRRQRLPALLRQRPQLAGDLPARLPARRSRDASPTTRAPAGCAGVVSGWSYDVGAAFGHNDFDYDISNTLQRVARALPGRALRAGARRRSSARRRSRASRTRPSFFAGRRAARGAGRRGSTSPSRSSWGCRRRSTWRSAPRSGGSATPSGPGSSPRTSTAVHLTRTATTRRPAGSQVVSRASRPATPPTATGPTSACMPTPRPTLPTRCWRTWPARFEDLQRLRLTADRQGRRSASSRRAGSRSAPR